MKKELTSNLKDTFWLSPFFDNFDKYATHFDYWSHEGDNCQLQVELPGVEKKDININLNKGHVEISASRKVKTKHGETSRSYHNYFSIPESVDEKSIEAEYSNGILTLTAHNLKNDPKQKIEIK